MCLKVSPFKFHWEFYSLHIVLNVCVNTLTIAPARTSSRCLEVLCKKGVCVNQRQSSSAYALLALLKQTAIRGSPNHLSKLWFGVVCQTWLVVLFVGPDYIIARSSVVLPRSHSGPYHFGSHSGIRAPPYHNSNINWRSVKFIAEQRKTRQFWVKSWRGATTVRSIDRTI